jgi:excisionase family DNA binding protein
MTRDLEIVLASARTLAPEHLPHLLGALEEIRTTAFARLIAPAPSQAQPDELLDIREAARRLGVSKEYLYRNHPRLNFTRRVGRRVLFSAQGIEKYIQHGHGLRAKRGGGTMNLAP